MDIELKNVSKRFGEFDALSNINLTINEGSLVALLGPSGSGKTTLLRIIAGLERADRREDSEILFGGINILDMPVRKREIGFVFQHYALFRHQTVFENIAFGLRVRPRRSRPSKKEIEARVHELLALIQLEGIQNRYPWQLSGGQRQRVALARALAVGPRILLLDEPFGALDARVRADLRQWLRRLHDELHVTSILVTHDQEEALEVADRIVVINNGRIEQEGTPNEVFHFPASPFVMSFLGHVNLFHGRMVGEQVVLCDAKSTEAESNPEAPIFVRPYELEIKNHPSCSSELKARVTRIQLAGPMVKIDLLTETDQAALVEMTHEQFTLNPIDTGQDVYLCPRKIRCFLDNGSGGWRPVQ